MGAIDETVDASSVQQYFFSCPKTGMILFGKYAC
jgi:hypothetical protein